MQRQVLEYQKFLDENCVTENTNAGFRIVLKSRDKGNYNYSLHCNHCGISYVSAALLSACGQYQIDFYIVEYPRIDGFRFRNWLTKYMSSRKRKPAIYRTQQGFIKFINSMNCVMPKIGLEKIWHAIEDRPFVALELGDVSQVYDRGNIIQLSYMCKFTTERFNLWNTLPVGLHIS